MPKAPLSIFPTPDALGDALAERVLARAEAARRDGRSFVLGCPTGRSPRPVFSAMVRRVAERPQDLGHVVLAMMDEYLVPGHGWLTHASPDTPWSCANFAWTVIVEPLNAVLPSGTGIPEQAVWFPMPDDPEEYERRIAAAGGIDLFLLASGASDGHVAFNPPGSSRDSRTRVIPLSDETRRDNLQTFPAFGTLDAVPHHGVSVGVDTIASSKEAVMIVWGSGKRVTLGRIAAADRYDPSWPATLIHECTNGEILADADAAAELR